MKKLLIIVLLFILCPNLWAGDKYIIPVKKDVYNLSMEILKSQVGVREATGRNDGKEVEMYLKSVGRFKGDAYCAAFQYWCFFEAVKRLGYDNSYIPINRTGLANGIYNFASETGVHSTFLPSVGDLLVWRNKGSYSGHIERITKVQIGGYVTTIGGNTSGTSLNEGDGVYVKRRHIKNPIGRMLVRGLVGFKQF
jgi:hypothetical protein